METDTQNSHWGALAAGYGESLGMDPRHDIVRYMVYEDKYFSEDKLEDTKTGRRYTIQLGSIFNKSEGK